MTHGTGREHAARPPRPVAGLTLGRFMAAVSLVGLPVVAWPLWQLGAVDWAGSPVGVPELVVLALALVVGELLPIEVARHGRRTDEITISSTVALAMIFVAPLGCVILAQAAPLVLDDLRRGKHWSRPVFN